MTSVAARPAQRTITAIVQWLLADASFLDERLAGCWVGPGEQVTDRGRDRLVRWRQRLGGPEALARRLAGLGADEPTALRALSGARWIGAPRAPWASLLTAHLAGPTLAQHHWPGAYGWLVGPITERAFAGLADRFRHLDPTGQVIAGALADQVGRAAWWLGPALHHSFADYRARRRHRLDIALLRRSGSHAHELFEDFAAAAGPGGIQVWRQRPVLARLCAQLAADAAATVAETLDKLAADAPTLAAQLNVSRLAPLRRLVTGAGDRHEGGRTVSRIDFADGRSVWFRPRRHDGLALLAGAQRRPWQLAGDHHAWVEHVAGDQPSDLRRYHERAGELLAVLRRHGATDIHRDNLVVTEDGPVVIDAETLAHPVTDFELALARELDDRPLPATALTRSVLRVGLLPSWDCSADGQVLDGAHLSPALPAVSRIGLPRVDRPGTDAEAVVVEPADLGARADLPAADYQPAGWTDAVLAGYDRVGADSPPERPAGLRARLLLRYTRRYLDVLLGALGTAALDAGVDLDVALAGLPPGGEGISPMMRAAEEADLRRLDVPYFEHEPATGAVLHHGRMVGRWRPAAAPAPSAATPSGSDGAVQRALISSALRCGDGAPTLTGGPTVEDVDGQGTRGVEAAMADLSGRLLTDLLDRSVPVADGISWLGFEHRHGRFPRLPVGWSLYDGQAGIAFALAAAATVHSDLAEPAAQALAPLTARALADPAGLCDTLGPGYLHGAAGIVWGLRHAGRLAGDRSTAAPAAAALEEELCRWLLGPAPERFGLDLAAGLAGAVAVLAAPGGGPGRAPERLRRAATRQATRLVVDAAVPAQPGLAHGAAGTALALARSVDHLDRDGQARAVAAVARHRATAATGAGWTWCSGAVGAALAGGTAPSALDVPGLPADAPHHLCCGVVGAAVVGAAPGGAPGTAADSVLSRLRSDARPRYLRPLPPGLHQPGLMQGAAGLALGLLLLAGPPLPNPLTLSAGETR
ncbi:DUF4135 domain-containing protein [Pilimelia columellifera]|uniref:Lantibiotic biosynthesis protein dehydration domain-containing protein n=1 Tax=Pilimelia columellifera subsp. columellifera TaxID=706583 RepID=A0ABN3NQ29_9ACTN